MSVVHACRFRTSACQLLVFAALVARTASAGDIPTRFTYESEVEAFRIEAMRAITQCATINGQAELYSITHGKYPDFAQGWKPLLHDQFLESAPANRLARGDAATRVVVLRAPGATGAQVPLDRAGWAWNAHDHVMYVAGGSIDDYRRAVDEAYADPADRSWSLDDYEDAGVPNIRRPWREAQMAAFANTVQRSGAIPLPRRGSAHSGSLFARVVASNNLDATSAACRSDGARSEALRRYADAFDLVRLLYAQAYESGAVSSADLVDVLAHDLAVQRRLGSAADASRDDALRTIVRARIQGLVTGLGAAAASESFSHPDANERLAEVLRRQVPIHPAVDRTSGGGPVFALEHQVHLFRTIAYSVLSMTDTLNRQIQTYRAQMRVLPDFAGRGWDELVNSEFIAFAPRNPFAADAVATRVVVLTSPGATGAQVSPEQAGWVWNSADGVLHPAGTSAAQLTVDIERARAVGPADRSPEAPAYALAGVPTPRRPWAADDIAALISAVGDLSRWNWGALPRFESEQTGALFARLTAEENLAAIVHGAGPPAARFQKLLAYALTYQALLGCYIHGYEHGTVGAIELAELSAHSLELGLELCDFGATIVRDTDRRDPTFATRTQGLQQARAGVAQQVFGVLQTIERREFSDPAALRRLVRALDDTLPELYPVLPDSGREQLRTTIGRLAAAPELGALELGLPALARHAERVVASVPANE